MSADFRARDGRVEDGDRRVRRRRRACGTDAAARGDEAWQDRHLAGGARRLGPTVATHRADHIDEQHLELPVEELLRRARPLPPYDEMIIEDVSVEEGAACLAAVDS